MFLREDEDVGSEKHCPHCKTVFVIAKRSDGLSFISTALLIVLGIICVFGILVGVFWYIVTTSLQGLLKMH